MYPFTAFSKSSFIEGVEVETRLERFGDNDEWEERKCQQRDSCRRENRSRAGFFMF